MAKNTYNFNFLIVQPIKLSSELLLTLFKANDTNQSNNFIRTNRPTWLKKLQDLGNTYQNFIVLDSFFDNTIILKEELLNKDFLINDQLSLSECIAYEKIEFSLLFDKNLKYFMFVYFFPLKFDNHQLMQYIEFNDQIDEKKDLYNTVRKIFVKEHEDSIISKWVKNTETSSLEYISKFLEQTYLLKDVRDQVSVLNNTGNITNFIESDHYNFIQSDQFIKKIKELNDFAEIKVYHNKSITLDDGTIYDFNGRFHSIIIGKKSETDRFIPIQFHIQLMWSYLICLYQLMDIINNEVAKSNNSFKNISDLNDDMEYCIQKVQYINLFHFAFLRGIESDSKNIYSEIQSLWNIDSSLGETDKYVTNFKDYLSRKHQKMQGVQQDKQSKILFIISIVQIISLIGVWQTYLGLTNSDTIPTNNRIVRIFGSIDNLILFNMTLPIFFVLIAIGLWFFGIKRKN